MRVNAATRQSEEAGIFLRSFQRKLQFWQIDDGYFDNPDMVNSMIRLPPEWLRPIQKSERHFSDEQIGLYGLT